MRQFKVNVHDKVQVTVFFPLSAGLAALSALGCKYAHRSPNQRSLFFLRAFSSVNHCTLLTVSQSEKKKKYELMK